MMQDIVGDIDSVENRTHDEIVSESDGNEAGKLMKVAP